MDEGGKGAAKHVGRTARKNTHGHRGYMAHALTRRAWS